MNSSRRDQVLAILQQHKADLVEQYGAISLGIFGSVARNEAREDSDVDIIVKLNKPSLFILTHLREKLMTLLDCNVDIVHESQSFRPFFRERLKQETITI